MSDDLESVPLHGAGVRLSDVRVDHTVPISEFRGELAKEDETYSAAKFG